MAHATACDGRPFLRIAVQDSGHGIAPDLLPQLFVSFVTTKPRGTGTGLGLRICRRIIEEMGGSISAANRAAGGACFEILLPAARQASRSRPRRRRYLSESGSSPPRPPFAATQLRGA